MDMRSSRMSAILLWQPEGVDEPTRVRVDGILAGIDGSAWVWVREVQPPRRRHHVPLSELRDDRPDQ